MEGVVGFVIGVVMGTLLGMGLYGDMVSNWVERGNFTYENVTYKIVKADVVAQSDNTNVEEK